jgi:hypothetical protein
MQQSRDNAPIGLSVSSWEALDTGKKYSRKSDDRKGMNIEAKVQ